MARKKFGEKKIIFTVEDNIKDILFNAILNQNKNEVPNEFYHEDGLSFDNLIDFIFWAVKPQDFVITHRTIKYLFTAHWLCNNYNGDYEKNGRILGKGKLFGGDGYIHHDLMHDYCFKHYNGVDFTSYTKLAQAPYDFLEPKYISDKKERDGTYTYNQKCVDLLNNKIKVPERIIIIKNEVVYASKKEIGIIEALGNDISFKEARKIYNQIVL